MNPVSQTQSDNVAGARQRKDVKYFARAALATFVTLKMACLVTGCATQGHRSADVLGASSARHLTRSPGADGWPGDGDAARSTGDAASPSIAELARQWFMPARDFSPSASTPAATDQSEDVWAHLRRGFQLDDRDDARITRAAANYRGKPESWALIEERARQFLPLIVREVERRRMPLELALVPVIESTFNATAVSPGKAAGLWQIVPGTAKTLGLERNGHYDGRRDVLAATGAALDYLQTLAGEFGGDWELALASYNAGSGTVRRAIAKNRQNGRPTDYWSLDLPAETEVYVPKLLAVARVIKYPRSFGLQLADIPAEPELTPVQVDRQIDISLAAKLAEMSLTEMRELNPGLLSTRSQLPSQQSLLVPTEKAPVLMARLDERAVPAIAESRPTVESPGGQSEPAKTPAKLARTADKTHVVGKGDSLWAVAKKHSVKVAELAKANGIKPGTPLREGQRLTIPDGAPRTSQLLDSVDVVANEG